MSKLRKPNVDVYFDYLENNDMMVEIDDHGSTGASRIVGRFIQVLRKLKLFAKGWTW